MREIPQLHKHTCIRARGIEVGPRTWKNSPPEKSDKTHKQNDELSLRLFCACCVFFYSFLTFSRARKGEYSKYSKILIGIDADLKSNYLLKRQRGARFEVLYDHPPSRSPFVPSKFRNSHFLQALYFALTIV